MKYLVFESGSRAGFSAEMFFRAWQKRHHRTDVKLIMADSDWAMLELPNAKGILRKHCQPAEARVGEKGVRVFPGDELTRQRNEWIQKAIENDIFAKVEDWYYDKSKVNRMLHKITDGKTFIKIPKTFELNEVCIKPNTLSAGSKNIQFEGNVCIEELIDIKTEYVADVLEINGEFCPFVREVTLRSGYDKLIKLLPPNHILTHSVRQFLEVVSENTEDRLSLFKGIFHLQIAEDDKGQYYFIEASKRISGTSIVNIFNGFNPFDLIEGTEFTTYPNPFDYWKWYRYEDFILELSKII